MNNDIYRKLPLDFNKYKTYRIEGGASKKIFYKLIKNSKQTFIIIDFNDDKKEYQNHLKIFKILNYVNVSIPNIIEKNDTNSTIICEDFGDLRFDKILNQYPINSLLQYAVDTLVEIQNSTIYSKDYNLEHYNFTTFVREIEELPEYYFPFIKLNNKNLKEEFISIWQDAYKKIDFKFDSFTHKDFNLNNLILIPSRKKHLKCGIVDFQSAFWGESSWDLFSLLEDSRILFTDKFNEDLMDYFFSKTKLNISLLDFKMKYYFLNFSRQTRLLGRWVKLAKDLNKDWYLKFIPVTQNRLRKNINKINDTKLKKFYERYIIT